MKKPNISADDIEDVKQLTDELVDKIEETLRDHDLQIALSAVISSMISTVMNQCNCIDEVIFFQKAFFTIFERSIKEAKENKFYS